MTLIPYGINSVCSRIEDLRDFIEHNRRYFSEVKHDKAAALECDVMLVKGAIHCQMKERGETGESD